MGNWRTVHIVGTLDPADVEPLREFLLDRSHFGPLSITNGLCGLGDWPAETMDVSGNLAERNFTVHDVYDALWPLIVIAPSMNLVVHCGGEDESTECVATITVADRMVDDGPPEVTTVPGVPEPVMMARLLSQVLRPPDLAN